MGKTTIEWTEYSWNPLRGTKGRWHCTKVSRGCANCYAERQNVRFGGPAYVVGADKLRLDMKNLLEPFKWPSGAHVFVCSMTDLFHETVEQEWLDAIHAVMWLNQHLVFQVLTKRPGMARAYYKDPSLSNRITGALVQMSSLLTRPHMRRTVSMPPEWPFPNVWLGTSVEDHYQAWRIDEILDAPAVVHWVSAEPMLGPIDFDIGDWLNRIDWIVVGGESGPGARPMHPRWAIDIRNQCAGAGVPFHFKQWGEWAPNCLCRSTTPHPTIERPSPGPAGVMFRCGKKAAGRELDGRTHDEMPEIRRCHETHR